MDHLAFAKYIVRELDNARIIEGVSRKEMADRMGMFKGDVSRMLNTPRNLSIAVINRFLMVLGKRARIVIEDDE